MAAEPRIRPQEQDPAHGREGGLLLSAVDASSSGCLGFFFNQRQRHRRQSGGEDHHGPAAAASADRRHAMEDLAVDFRGLDLASTPCIVFDSHGSELHRDG
ncbi:uncharacterized protein LOC125534596 [Triticum urartu]|uniref:uncharacterized protein LOC125534596 n=1 Tax=Triticum urartu TaxID=4572 RepID=UPI0020442B66|nr:uncharacterized protein LOC125534596 [Triticum urartu]